MAPGTLLRPKAGMKVPLMAMSAPRAEIPPAIAICLLALGVLERDGLWVMVGFAVAIVLHEGTNSLLIDGFIFVAAGLGSLLALRLLERDRRQVVDAHQWISLHVLGDQRSDERRSID